MGTGNCGDLYFVLYYTENIPLLVLCEWPVRIYFPFSNFSHSVSHTQNIHGWIEHSAHTVGSERIHTSVFMLKKILNDCLSVCILNVQVQVGVVCTSKCITNRLCSH